MNGEATTPVKSEATTPVKFAPAPGSEPGSSSQGAMYSPPTTPVAKLNGSSGPNEELSSDVSVLQQQVAALRAELRVERTRTGMWEECMRQLCVNVMLSPDMNDIYKVTCTTLLQDALSSVEQVQRVIYVDCSFPSVPAEAPRLALQKWSGMDYSEWDLSWKPSWSVQVAIEGSHYLQFQLMLKISDVRVAGKISLAMATDPAFSKISISFLEMYHAAPEVSIKTECAVSWGATPLPIQEYIGAAVEDYFQAYVRDSMVAPNSFAIAPASFQPKASLTDEDVERAIRAVDLARSYSDAHSL